MPRSAPQLRKQLLGWLLVPLFLLLALDSFVSYRVALEFSRRAYDRSLVEIARELSLHLRREAGGITLDLPAEARRILLEDPEDRIYHEVVAGGRRVSGEAMPPRPARSAEGDGRERFHDATLHGEPVRIVELDVPAARGAPAAIVRVAETTQRRNALAREILLAVVLPQALLLAVAGIVVWIGVARGLAPLERLRRAVAARSHREWSPVAEQDVPGEVRPLLQAIDELVARLDHALTLQERFIGDAAHQLKTPITVLKANLELALREDEPARARESLIAAHQGLERLSRIVLQLLSLARNEPEALGHVTLVPMDLNATALEAASAWVPAALKRGIDLGFEGHAEPVMIRGDAGRVRELLDNLIDNAVRYSPDGGRVTVRVDPAPAAVHVDDDGPRIPAAERQRVFERFHRLLGDVQGGSGLGLAIAREIARIHEATIALEDDADGVGNTFSVRFPAL
jgi:two-component system, OmpR family, sensor histidine kinase TctE